MGLFKPKYKNKDPRVRQAALAKVDKPEILNYIVQNDPDWRVRASAIEKVYDQEILGKLALHEDVYEVRKKAIRKVRDKEILWKVITMDETDGLRIMAVKRLGWPDKLASVIEDSRQAPSVRKAAINNIEDLELLKEEYDKIADENIKTYIKNRINPFFNNEEPFK